ncbi:MAG: hypothetical protein EXQ58_08560 [Acidobacteria bacterium]|nr:hypothetical protein [Acidobacteriota bacterium]
MLQLASRYGDTERAGKRLELFWEEFAAVACTESISQTKFASSQKILSQKRETYDYLIVLQLEGDDLAVEESRLLKGKLEKKSRQPLLVTNGFSTLRMILHPLFQSSYEFTRLPDEGVKTGRLLRIGFQPIAGKRSPSVIQAGGKDYPIPWQGSAWIDSQSGMVVRIQTELSQPIEDLGLKILRSEVNYAMIRFQSVSDTCWLPQTALVEAETAHQRWRNIHHFQNYRKFSVETQSKTDEPQVQ